jgi:Ca2+-binding EF-hand superfamily protein
LSAEDLDDILRGMGFRPSKEELKDILEEIDEDGSGEIEFAEFCQVNEKMSNLGRGV